MSDRKKKAIEHAKTLKRFMSWAQLSAMATGIRTPEREYFYDSLEEMAERVEAMPKTYEQDGKGDEAVAYLHYFTPNLDFYITEKDMEVEQLQAFGLIVNSHKFAELGYVSLEEITKHGAELDLHFEPTTIGEIKSSIV